MVVKWWYSGVTVVVQWVVQLWYNGGTVVVQWWFSGCAVMKQLCGTGAAQWWYSGGAVIVQWWYSSSIVLKCCGSASWGGEHCSSGSD